MTTHEARARAWVRAFPVYTEAQCVAYLATAFAEVEAEFAGKVQDRIIARVGSGVMTNEMGTELMRAILRDLRRDPEPDPKHCQECGKKPCETFIVCASKEMERSGSRRGPSSEG